MGKRFEHTFHKMLSINGQQSHKKYSISLAIRKTGSLEYWNITNHLHWKDR